MLDPLRRRWFLVSLLIIIPGGLWLGSVLSSAQFGRLEASIPPPTTSLLVALILFLMSVTLDNRRLRASLARPGPVCWATLVTFGLLPLAAWPLSRLQLTADFQVGLAIAACVPCTMAAASVWTRKAQGNDAVSLLVTLLTNGGCFLVTPLWLQFLLPSAGGGETSIQLDTAYLMKKLMISALLPILAGQVCRTSAMCAAFADRHKVPLGVVAQSCILVIVCWESIKAGPNLQEGGGGLGVAAVALVWGSCIGLHLAAMLAAWWGARAIGFAWDDRVAIAFASSQKTLPIGVYIASGFSDQNAALAVLPMLMYHASQLFIDTAVADRLVAARPVERAAD